MHYFSDIFITNENEINPYLPLVSDITMVYLLISMVEQTPQLGVHVSDSISKY